MQIALRYLLLITTFRFLPLAFTSFSFVDLSAFAICSSALWIRLCILFYDVCILYSSSLNSVTVLEGVQEVCPSSKCRTKKHYKRKGLGVEISIQNIRADIIKSWPNIVCDKFKNHFKYNQFDQKRKTDFIKNT